MKNLVKAGKMLALCALIVSTLAATTVYAAQYDPNEGFAKDTVQGQFFYDINALTELLAPGVYTAEAEAVPEGGGKYELKIRQRDLLYDNILDFKEYEITMESGVINGLDAAWAVEGAPLGAFTRAGDRPSPNSPYFAQSKKELELLSQTHRAKAYYSFAKDMALDEFIDFMGKYKDVAFGWAAVRVYDPVSPPASKLISLGFDPQQNGTEVETDNSDYPVYAKDLTAENMRQRFEKLLEYAISRGGLTKNFVSLDYLESALKYVKANGVSIYGFAAAGEAAAMKRLAGDGQIEAVGLADVKCSVFSRR